ncbi:acetolactate synthase, large subunit, biosynthetic type [Cohnella sp. CIP 111063]|uniref:biosynthetic-type acetolactate synthase large subunit n=1 Tax=unclassified Cohnella TaxID=2636738 RepID=UPI000B8C049A|nr:MULTISPECIES: biosynthetic-type acetolactate synthase large subunit [unclassified Cohnella]OXS54257.1 acetolactate synthase, large subunit, biosynthetic type [Cohnella sp. CIP 111063]PRX63449.1 acetolactate synthase large subunit [Cohnella sp. SGD-V74]
MTGAQALIELLMEQGVKTLFGYPGGAVLPVYDALFDCGGIQHVLVRHEQAAVHAADGYARATGRPGVALVTSGPGATNTVTGIATAYMDSVPLVVLTGQVPTEMIGLDSFQEVDIYGMTMPITKHNFIAMKAEDLPRIVREAFHIATTGRPGPVLIDLPKNVMASILPDRIDLSAREPVRIRGYAPDRPIGAETLDEIAERLNGAERPLLLVGGGCMAGTVPARVRELADRCGLPVASTLMGIGAFPSRHPLYLGMIGMHGTARANRAVHAADVLVGLGMRFNDRVTGSRKAFSPHSYKIQIDIDESELNKNIGIDLAVCGSLEEALDGICARMEGRSRDGWVKTIAAWSKRTPTSSPVQGDRLTPQEVIRCIDEATAGDAIVATDVGQHQIWTAHHYGFAEPRSFLTSGGLGTMGYGFPAAIGAAFAFPDRQVVCVSGDGSFQMNLQEIMTAVDYGLNVKVAILKNGYLGMVRQWQQLFLGRRYSSVQISSPDFPALARSFGAQGFSARTLDEAQAVIAAALRTEGPVIMEFDVTEEANVYPIVPPGASNQEMIEEEA